MKHRIHYAYYILFVSMLLITGSIGLARFGYSLVLPDMKETLALSYTETGLLQTFSFAAYAVCLLIAGALSNRIGAPRLATFSLVVVGLSTALTAVANSFGSALLLRVITGSATAGVYVPVSALTAAWFVSSRRGVASGVVMGGMGLGIVLSGWGIPPILSGFGDLGWRLAWVALGVPILLLAIASHLVLRSSPAERGLEPIGGSAAQDRPPLKPPSTSMYRWWPLWHLAIVYLLYGIAFSGYITFFTAYAIAEGGFDVNTAGVLWSAIGALSIVGGPLWGQVSDRIGRGPGLALGLLFQAAAYTIIGVSPTTPAFIASVLLYGIAAWSVPTVMTAACGDFVGERGAARAIGFIVSVHSIGLIIGPFLFGRIGDVTHSFALALITAGAIAAFAAILALATARPAPLPAPSHSLTR